MVRSDELGLIWITEKVNTDDGGEFFIVIGPMFLKRMTKEMLMQKLSSMQLSLSMQFRFRKLLEGIPVADQSVLGAFSRMLHFTIYDEYMGPTEVHYEKNPYHDTDDMNFFGTVVSLKNDSERGESGEMNSGENNYARMSEVENILLNCVRTGIFRESKANDTDSRMKYYNGELQNYGLKDELRTAKDNVIIFVDKCMNAAVEGGLPVPAARKMENEAVCRIEECRTLSSLANVNWDTFLSYVEAVRKSGDASRSGVSQAVQETLNYIMNNCRKNMTLSDLAKNVNYSEYYLSRKFTKETGYKIQDYIKEVRINTAKVELLTSGKSINDIAEGLQFKSRSHFDRNFKEAVGVTPAQYREGRRSAMDHQKA